MRLYNLKDDPVEQRPLGREHKMYGMLFGELRNHIIRSGRVAWQRPAESGE
jgi:hypothetical protein